MIKILTVLLFLILNNAHSEILQSPFYYSVDSRQQYEDVWCIVGKYCSSNAQKSPETKCQADLRHFAVNSAASIKSVYLKNNSNSTKTCCAKYKYHSESITRDDCFYTYDKRSRLITCDKDKTTSIVVSKKQLETKFPTNTFCAGGCEAITTDICKHVLTYLDGTEIPLKEGTCNALGKKTGYGCTLKDFDTESDANPCPDGLDYDAKTGCHKPNDTTTSSPATGNGDNNNDTNTSSPTSDGGSGNNDTNTSSPTSDGDSGNNDTNASSPTSDDTNASSPTSDGGSNGSNGSNGGGTNGTGSNNGNSNNQNSSSPNSDNTGTPSDEDSDSDGYLKKLTEFFTKEEKLPESPTLPIDKTPTFDKKPQDFDKPYVSVTAYCPNDPSVNFDIAGYKTSFSFPMKPICDFGSKYLKYIVQFMAYIVATLSIGNAFKV